MPYRLLFEISVINNKNYAPWLRPREAVRGIPCDLSVTVRNLGDTFPGGKINEIKFSTPALGLVSLEGIQKANVSLPELKTHEKFNFKVPEITFINPGLTKISIKVETKDEEKIEYFQSEEGPPIKEDYFFNFIYVIDRNLLDLIVLVANLLKERKLNEQ